MSIPAIHRPVMGRISHLANVIRGPNPLTAVIDFAFAQVREHPTLPLWNKEVDKEIHASLSKSAMKVMQGTYQLTYADVPTPSYLEKDEERTYWLKKEIAPMEGLAAFLEGPTHTDCGGAAKAITLQAIAEVLGEEKFNALLSHPETRLNFTKSVSRVPNPLDFFMLPAHIHFHSTDRSHITLGTRVYFLGIPWYGIKHPTEHAHGYWAIYLDNTPAGEPLYWALGFNKLMTEEEILENLVNSYNESPSEESEEFLQKFSKEEFLGLMMKIHASKLQGYEQEVKHCYDNPHVLISLEEAKSVGIGFFGYALTERVSSVALRILREAPLSTLKDPSTPLGTGTFHVSQLFRQLINTEPEAPNIPKTTREAKNFTNWVKEKP